MIRLLLISSWFQALWLLAVLGNEAWQWWLLALVVATYAVTIGVSVKPLPLRFVGIVFVVGIGIDSVNMLAGVLRFEDAMHSTWLIPIWLSALWAIFIWYSTFLLPLVNTYPSWIVTVIGGLSGALSYWAGERLGAVEFGYPPTLSLLILFGQWVFVMGLMLRIYGNEKDHDIPV